MRQPDRISRLLENPQLGRSLSDLAWESVIHCLRDERLLATLHARAEQAGVLSAYSDFARRHLDSMRVFADRQAAQVRYECRQLHADLQAKNVTAVFLKGASYTLRRAPNSAGRIYSDIDLLVRREEIEDAERELQRRGYYRQMLSDYDDRYYREWAHEIPPLFHLQRGTVVDLHHNLLPPISGRAVAADLLFRDTVDLPGGFRVLSLEASILHSVIHLLVNDDLSYAYRDLVDLWLLLGALPTDGWQRLLQIAREAGFDGELWYALRLVRERFPSFQPALDVSGALDDRFDTFARRSVATKILALATGPTIVEEETPGQRLARSAAVVRGHWLKMPLPVLIRHTLSKAWIELRDRLFGRYQFER